MVSHLGGCRGGGGEGFGLALSLCSGPLGLGWGGLSWLSLIPGTCAPSDSCSPAYPLVHAALRRGASSSDESFASGLGLLNQPCMLHPTATWCGCAGLCIPKLVMMLASCGCPATLGWPPHAC